MSDRLLVEQAIEGGAVRDVAAGDRHVSCADEPQPPVVGAEVEADHRGAGLSQDGTRPRPDAAQRTRDEKPFVAVAHGST